GSLQWLRLSDRDEFSRLAKKIPDSGNPDRLHRPGRWYQQDVWGDCQGGRMDGLAPETDGAPEASLRVIVSDYLLALRVELVMWRTPLASFLASSSQQ